MSESGDSPPRRITRVVATVAVALIFGGLLYLRAWPPIVVVMSSSMEPAIDTGAIVLMRHVDGPPDVGDVVKVPVPAEARATGYPDEVLHRVIEVTDDGFVRTKGDNLDEPDPFAVPVAAVSNRALKVIPGAGRLVAFLFSPYGIMWVGAGVFLFVLMPFFDGQRELKLAVAEYGYHLRSHTQILQSMSLASQDLAVTTDRLRESLAPHEPDSQEPDSQEPVGTLVEIDIPAWIHAPGDPPDSAGREIEIDIPDWVHGSSDPEPPAESPTVGAQLQLEIGPGSEPDAPTVGTHRASDGHDVEIDIPEWLVTPLPEAREG